MRKLLGINANEIKYKKRHTWFFSIFIVSTFLSSLTLFSINLNDFVSISITPFYLLLITSGLALIISPQKALPYSNLLIYCIYIFIHALICAPIWGIDKVLFKYIFGFLIMAIFYTFGKKNSIDDWLLIFKRASIIIIIFVYLNLFYQYDKILYFISNIAWMNHPVVSTLTSGGVNLEATWIALLSISFSKHKSKWIYWCFSVLLSGIYASRVGLIINILCMMYFLYKSITSKNFTAVIFIVMFLLLFSIVCIKFGILEHVFSRLNNLTSDTGSIGRLNMWKHVLNVIERHPMGVGIGNSNLALEKMSGTSYAENNLHNLIFQMFCDLGIIGGLWYIGIISVFTAKEYKKINSNPFVVMLFIYIIAGFIQFKGGEAIMICILSVYLCTNNENIDYKKTKYSAINHC